MRTHHSLQPFLRPNGRKSDGRNLLKTLRPPDDANGGGRSQHHDISRGQHDGQLFLLQYQGWFNPTWRLDICRCTPVYHLGVSVYFTPCKPSQQLLSVAFRWSVRSSSSVRVWASPVLDSWVSWAMWPPSSS